MICEPPEKTNQRHMNLPVSETLLVWTEKEKKSIQRETFLDIGITITHHCTHDYYFVRRVTSLRGGTSLTRPWPGHCMNQHQ